MSTSRSKNKEQGQKFSRIGDKLFITRLTDRITIPFKAKGMNDNAGSWAHPFGSPYANITNVDNPITTELFSQLLGRDNPDNINTQGLNCNIVRAYLPSSGTVVTEIKQKDSSYASSVNENYENNVLYFDNLLSLGINVTSFPTININWGAVPTVDRGRYLPVIIDSNNNISNSGRVLGLVIAPNASRNITALLLAGMTITISGGGLATPVDIKPKAIIRKRSIYERPVLSDYGTGYKKTGENKGMATYFGQKNNYYYSMFDVTDRDTNNTVEPKIFGRIRRHDMFVPPSGAIPAIGVPVFDMYSNTNQNVGTFTASSVFDLFVFDGGEYMPRDQEENFKVRTGLYLSDNSFQRYIDSNVTVFRNDYLGFQGVDDRRDPEKFLTKTYTDVELEDYYNTMKQNGIHTMFNYFKFFQPYNSGGFAQDQNVRKQQYTWWQSEEKTNLFRELAKLCKVTGGKKGDQILLALGNESNLDYTLKGIDYSLGSPTYGQNIYWADPANPLSRSANLTFIANYYNNLAKLIKLKYKDKFCIGVVLQYADATQATEIQGLMNGGLLSSLDWIGNNYYGNGSVANPELNPASFNAFTDYKTNVNSTYRLPMILTEAGTPNIIYLVPNALASVGDKKTLPLDPSIITYNYATEQATLMANLSNNLLNNPVYDFVAGVIDFPMFTQFGRGDSYDYSAYNGFNFPKPLMIAGQPSYNPANYTAYYNEKDFYIYNFPDKDLVNLANDYTNIPTDQTAINSRKTSSYNSLRASNLANHTNLTYNL